MTTPVSVDAADVIEELLVQIANLHRENAILKVQTNNLTKPQIESETPQ